MSREAMRQALDALEKGETKLRWAAISALKQALAEPEQEPVAWMKVENFIDAEGLWDERVSFNHDGDGKPLYTAPTPQHDTDCHLQGICQRSGYSIANTQRRPMTDEEIIEHFEAEVDTGLLSSFADGVRFAERAHGIGEQT